MKFKNLGLIFLYFFQQLLIIEGNSQKTKKTENPKKTKKNTVLNPTQPLLTTQASQAPSKQPSTAPSFPPSVTQSLSPSSYPSKFPSVKPTENPSTQPSSHPSAAPSVDSSPNLSLNFEVQGVTCNFDSDCEGPGVARSCVTASCSFGTCSYSYENARKIFIVILTDAWPSDTNWKLFEPQFSLDIPVAEGSQYTLKHTEYRHSLHVCNNINRFEITDTYGDGITDGSAGYFLVEYNSFEIVKGNDFGKEYIEYFQLCDVAETCRRRQCATSFCNSNLCTSSATSNLYKNVTVELKTDMYPIDTLWNLRDVNENMIYAIGEGYTQEETLYQYNTFACYGEQVFTIRDEYGDGICCTYGNGFYNVYVENQLVLEGGNFGFIESMTFHVNGPFSPSSGPSNTPTVSPSRSQSLLPSKSSSSFPSKSPSSVPSNSPTLSLTKSPTLVTSKSPSSFPSTNPSSVPSNSPTLSPTKSPSFSPTNNPTSTPTISTYVLSDKLSYLYREPVVITFQIFSSTKDDWIGIYDCVTDEYWDGSYTCGLETCIGGTSYGTLTFIGIDIGCYVASIVDVDSFELAFSTNFEILPDPDTWIETDQIDYTADEVVVVTFQSSFPGQDDWIGIFPCGIPDATETVWELTNGDSSGSIGFTSLAGGCYVAYLLDVNYNTIAISSSFNVNTAIILTDKEIYLEGETVIVSFQYVNSQQGDWVGIYDCNSYDLETWQLTSGSSPSEVLFSSLVAGCYVASYHDVNDVEIVSSSIFNVEASNDWIQTNKEIYLTGEIVTVNFQYLNSQQGDWVGIYDCDTYESVTWYFTSGTSLGVVLVDSLVAGCYFASYHDINDVEIVSSSNFIVEASTAMIETDKILYSVGETVIVSFQYQNSQQGDWIGVYDCDDYGFVTWDYTNGASPGEVLFDSLGAGCYVVSYHDVNDFEIVYSEEFTVA